MAYKCWDQGQAARVAERWKNVQKLDIVKSVTFAFAYADIENIITASKGRSVQCAIWQGTSPECVYNDRPIYTSSECTYTLNSNKATEVAFDTNILKNTRYTVTETSENFLRVTFSFDAAEIPWDFPVYIGLIGKADGSLCYKSDTTDAFALNDDGDTDQYSNSGLYVVDQDIESDIPANAKKAPPLVIEQITSRTISNGSGDATSDSEKVTGKWFSFKPQQFESGENVAPLWNMREKVFDIREGMLRDINYLAGGTDKIIASSTGSGDNRTSKNPLWLHSRSRLMIVLNPLRDTDGYSYYSKTARTEVSYYVEQNPSSKKEVRITEVPGDHSVLFICPRDEGVNDNEPMNVVIKRTAKDKNNTTIGTSSVTIRFYTYAEPNVTIMYPKDHIHNTAEGKGNDILWATEVLNEPYSEDRDASTQICSALNLLLSKEGGDNSGLPIFTRVYIEEYKGTYKNGEFKEPSNDKIKTGKVKPTAQWVGLQLDDGTLMQISGMKPEGFTWSWISEDDMSEFNDRGVLTHISSSSTEEKSLRAAYPHSVIASKSTNENSETTYTLQKDYRIVFRAEHKYLIKVRRFHSAVAGVLGLVNESTEAHSDFLANAHAWGGNYRYCYNCEDEKFEYDGAPGARGGNNICGNTANRASSNPAASASEYNGYPLNDSSSWISESNRRTENGAGPIKTEDGATTRYSWIGPDTDEFDEITYPGFSAHHSVILDCCHAMSTRENIITSRPATQEIGADHWLTFGYRHLAKGLYGLDTSYFSDKDKRKLSSEPLNPDGSISKRNATGTGFGETWSGYDNTITRIARMYQVLMNKAFEKVSAAWQKALHEYPEVSHGLTCPETGGSHEVSCDDHRQITHADVKIFLDHQGHPGCVYKDGTGMKTTNFETELLFHDPEYTGDYNTLDWTGGWSWMQDKLFSPMHKDLDINNTPLMYLWCKYVSGNGNTDFSKCRTYSYIFGGVGSVSSDIHPSVKNYDLTQFGNIYEWVPIINGTTSSNNNLAQMTTSDSSYSTNSEEFADLLTAAAGKVDKSHVPNIQNRYQGWLNVFADPSGKVQSPKLFCEYGTNDGYLYTSLSDWSSYYNISAKDTWDVAAFKGNLSDYGSQSIQYYSDLSGRPQGASPSQGNPGKLYIVVPPCYDCENGIVTNDRAAIPTRRDANYPLVRTSHYLWYKTHIHGKILVEMTIYGYSHDIGQASCYTTGEPPKPTHVYPSKCKRSDIYIMATESGEDSFNFSTSTEEIVNRYYPIPTNWGLTINRSLQYHAASKNSAKASVGIAVTEVKEGTYTNIFEVYGEDNGGMGRCLSADDSTSLWYSGRSDYDSTSSGNNGLDGGIEIPIRVRYTPLVQPMITTDSNILKYTSIDKQYPHSTKNSNIIKVKCNPSSQKAIAQVDNVSDSSLHEKPGMTVSVSYGMYRSAMAGRYVSRPLFAPYSAIYDKDATNWGATYQEKSQLKLFSQLQTSTVIDTLPVKAAYGTMKANNTDWWNYNSDTYPAVGICNAFMVILVPTDKNAEYSDHLSSFYEKRQFEEDWKLNTRTGPVIIADMAATDIYRYISSVDDALDKTDHKLRTLLNCKLDWYNLLYKKNNSIYTNATSISKNREFTIQEKTWYDLVVVPIFTDYSGFSSDWNSDYNFTFNPSKATKIDGISIASESDTKAGQTRFYGSSPLVVRKYLQIPSVSVTGGGGGPTPDPEDNNVIKEAPFATEGCIVYPNVNTYLFNKNLVDEVSGFWLNNTFRVICRAPHFRRQTEIDRWLSNNNATMSMETSLEEAMQLTNKGDSTTTPEQEQEFTFTDCMIHFGKYEGNVMLYKGSGEFEDTGIKFNSDAFQNAIYEHAEDKEWLNARGIYTMRTNSEAFSKCTPAQQANGDLRDVIKAGNLYSSSGDEKDRYWDRFVEFNPAIVDVHTPYKEGYYIQVRFLTAEQGSSSQDTLWTAWAGGVMGGGVMDKDGNAIKFSPTDTNTTGNDLLVKDYNLSYYVPTRDWNKITTEFRHYIKESTPGSGLTTPVRNDYWSDTSWNIGKHSIVPGSGSESVLTTSLPEIPESITDLWKSTNMNPTYFTGSGNYHDANSDDLSRDTDIVPSSPLDALTLQRNIDFPKDNPATFTVPSSIDNKHQRYWEMNYVDYIIRNMAKLYHSEWSEALPGNKVVVTAEDIGWTKAKSYAYGHINGIQRLANWAYDASEYNKDAAHLTPGQKSEPKPDKGQVANVNRYFRKNITYQDYASLLKVLKHTTSLLRDSRLTGKHVVIDDPKVQQVGWNDIVDNKSKLSYGFSVLAPSPEIFELTELRNSAAEGNFEVGHLSTIPYSPDSITPKYTTDQKVRVDANYMQQLLSLATTRMIQE